jgi:hypothetical protein
VFLLIAQREAVQLKLAILRFIATLEGTMSIREVALTSWDQIHSYSKRRWIYRGQQNAAWDLSTSLERCCNREEVEAGERQR